MIAYTKNEIIPVTKIARHLSEILNKLKVGELKKVAISKNNQLESVILPIEEYELLQDIYDQVEHMNIFNLIKDRAKTPIEEYIPFEVVLRENE
ncbi:MAG: hypothetical protein MUF15_26135 [Acidobacteria bacterium]|jgi:hypothetical protein|nr:hypothetical protein [Acidobacteriota bacterium]